jgi:predicted TIM-barrel fold metal-dependent hydrolase
MAMHWLNRILAIGALVAMGCAPSRSPTPRPEAGQGVFVGDELLFPYTPQSTLVTPTTRILKPRFPAIDVHCHWTLQQDPNRMLAAMDELGISHAVNLSGGSGAALEKMIAVFHAADADRFIIFANVDFKDFDEPGWSEREAKSLREAKALGAKGLKVFKSLGTSIRDSTGRLVSIDDARLDPIWDVCGELGFPVLIHSADPIAFFHKVDPFNERWMQLKRNPGWSFYGTDVPGFDELLIARNRVIANHPKTNFIVAHMAEGANDYAKLSGWLDAMPNMSIDLSARENEYGRQPRASSDFFTKYADRILFGTDRYPGRVDQPRNRIYYRILETRDEYFDYYEHPYAPMGEWKVYGMNLPDEVLRKIYAANAKRLLGIP